VSYHLDAGYAVRALAQGVSVIIVPKSWCKRGENLALTGGERQPVYSL